MKKQISAMAALVILFASCLKVTEQAPTDATSGDATRSANTQTIVDAVNTTVTTESALKQQSPMQRRAMLLPLAVLSDSPVRCNC
jgi:hypothetical protein